METAGGAYNALLELGIPPEDARFVLPNACCTHIVVTMNARELLHFFKLRCCRRAQWEIRSVAEEMLRLAREAAPALFGKAGPACVWGSCGEGKLTCGQAGDVRRRFRDDG
jgi:thymidylate synthase (FAD)